jgi:hypothetical protein
LHKKIHGRKYDKLPPKLTKRKVDALWSELVKVRDGRECAICHSTSNLNSHHIKHKASHLLRYNLLNGLVLCCSCHKFGIHHPDFDVAKWYIERIEKLVGPNRLEYLRELQNSKVKLSLSEAWERLNGKV